MPANWTILQTSISSWFDNNQVRKTERDTANHIAQSYFNAVTSANITLIPGSVLIPAAPSLIASGFENTFRILKTKQGPPTPADFTLAANGIVQFWLVKLGTVTATSGLCRADNRKSNTIGWFACSTQLQSLERI